MHWVTPRALSGGSNWPKVTHGDASFALTTLAEDASRLSGRRQRSRKTMLGSYVALSTNAHMNRLHRIPKNESHVHADPRRA